MFTSVHADNTVSAMSFYDVTGAAERMRITSAGNVGIGLTNPSAPLNPAASNQTDNTKAALFVSDGTTTTKGVAVGYNSTPNYGFIQSVNKGVAYTFLSLQPEGANVLVGTTTNNGSGGTLQVSNGITFPATQSAVADANTLDDYEEGTWTPILSAGSGSITSYTSSGTYTKIGRTVVLNGIYTVTNNGTGGTYGNIAGFPFTVNGSGASTAIRIGGTTGNTATLDVGPGTSGNLWLYNNTYPWATNANSSFTLVYQI